MKYIPLFLFIIGMNTSNGQKANSFYLKLHQYDYPTNPLPVSCEVYGVSAQVANKSIYTYDYRGDKLVLHDIKVLWGGYDPGTVGYVPKLFTFYKYHKSTIPYDNGFLLKIEMDDVELYHEYTGKDNIYEVKGDYEFRLSITHQNAIVTADTLEYSEVLGTFASSLSDEDVHIIATNKASELAIYLNEKILTSSVNAFRRFARARIDLSYTKEYIKFYGISKTKKLEIGEKVHELHKRIKNLEKLDEIVNDRGAFNKEVNLLIEEFTSMKNLNDYAQYDTFKFYVHSNLASLYAITESFNKVRTNYETALTFNDKARFVGIITEELRKSNHRADNKTNLFDEEGKFKETFSHRYLEYYNTREKAIN
ncbi:hypothetical protein HZY62_04480 [Maribacter polysiphoniae]|uniref:Uncharacterized protein n=1 Tax=Maribacter polysiphoniae TaxID=429344 RepID=A0A316E5C9_9FLAO|nr:hypothetical protein [Maribacter polysiphoniae]MBD1259832.1 hypothetical protein [Maribacter polysiphoniae]PWK25286.1 hypothetical protein LX92_00025 [Maribacter polysiphoniae]